MSRKKAPAKAVTEVFPLPPSLSAVGPPIEIGGALGVMQEKLDTAIWLLAELSWKYERHQHVTGERVVGGRVTTLGTGRAFVKG